MRRFLVTALVILSLGLSFCRPAHAQNNCWNGADYSSTATGGHEDSKVIWGTSGALGSGGITHFCQMAVTNNSASTVWAMLFDSATLPANTAKPKLEFNVPASTTIGEFGYGMLMVNGVVVACSSTEGTLTVTVASACNFHVTVAR
jgi:hypothetical protein